MGRIADRDRRGRNCHRDDIGACHGESVYEHQRIGRQNGGRLIEQQFYIQANSEGEFNEQQFHVQAGGEGEFNEQQVYIQANSEIEFFGYVVFARRASPYVVNLDPISGVEFPAPYQWNAEFFVLFFVYPNRHQCTTDADARRRFRTVVTRA